MRVLAFRKRLNRLYEERGGSGKFAKDHLQGENWIENGWKRVNACKMNSELALQETHENAE